MLHEGILPFPIPLPLLSMPAHAPNRCFDLLANKRTNGTIGLYCTLYSDVVHISYTLTRVLVLLRRPNLDIGVT